MQLLRATFDRDRAYEKVSELLALEDNPERLAEKLNLPRDVEKIQAGITATPCKKLVTDVEKLKEFVELEKEIENIRSGNWTFAFMGKSFAEKKIEGLMEKRRKYGSLIETPRWFYKLDRVWLLNALRDYAFDASHQGDAEWAAEDVESLSLPMTRMFETGDVDAAKVVAQQLSKPFKDVDPTFILTSLEGHRTLYFDLESQAAFYFMPMKTETA